MVDESIAILRMKSLHELGGAQRLRRAARGLNGVFILEINYILGNVTVRYDAKKLTLAKIREALDPSDALPVKSGRRR